MNVPCTHNSAQSETYQLRSGVAQVLNILQTRASASIRVLAMVLLFILPTAVLQAQINTHTEYTGSNGYIIGSISTPYFNNLRSEFLITVPKDYVELAFSTFSTEDGVDVVSVFDGPSANYRLIGQYSGHTGSEHYPPDIIRSTNTSLFIVFTTP